MPGKQMAIDADLNAGLLMLKKHRREEKHLLLKQTFIWSNGWIFKICKGDAIAQVLLLRL